MLHDLDKSHWSTVNISYLSLDRSIVNLLSFLFILYVISVQIVKKSFARKLKISTNPRRITAFFPQVFACYGGQFNFVFHRVLYAIL